MDVKEIRRTKLLLLLGEHDNSQIELGKLLKLAPSQISQWVNRTRTISEESARNVERRAKKHSGWMDSVDNHYALTVAHAAASSNRVEQEPARYANEWPFPDVSVKQWNTLSDAAKAEAQGFVKGLLSQANRRRA
jgi:DNA-binding transcriptional regulator YdaS (Cro superfamily)